MPEIHRIRIVSVPEGPGIPEEVRKGWVGVEFNAEGPMPWHSGSLVNRNEYHGVATVYAVLASVALAALEKKTKEPGNSSLTM